MRAVLMGKHKRSAVGALEHLLERAAARWSRWWPRPSPVRRRETSSAWTWQPPITACGWSSDAELYAEIAEG